MKKNNLLKIIFVSLMMVVLIGLAGCGDKDKAKADKNVKTYTAVTEPTFPPFDTTDEDGEIAGFDMDLMNAIAEDQGFKVKYKSLEFDALIPALESKQADIITAGMNAEDPARQSKVDFSDTYYDSGLVVLVKKDSDIKGVDSFTPDMAVAGQIGTTSADLVNELKADNKIAKAVVLNKNSEAIQQLENGDIQAVIMDQPVAKNYLKHKKHGQKIKTVGEVLNAESYGFAVQKGNKELQKKINDGLANLKENGKYDKIYKKWFE